MDNTNMRIGLILFCSIIWSTVLFAIEIEINHTRGFYQQAIEVMVEASEPHTSIRYTTNGSKPTNNNGSFYRQSILIDGTTTLRLLAYNLTDTVEAAHTYIYLNEILSAAYMSNHIIKNTAYINLLDSAFTAIPSIAVTIPKGIKVGDNIDLNQIPATVEMFFSDGSSPGFSSPCGIKTWGGSPSNPKKNYRLVFKKKFGVSKLKYNVFNDGYAYAIPPVKAFDNLLLRAGSQDGLNAEYNNEVNAQFIRNRFVCDLAMEMGYPAPHGRFVHLFLNGAYAGHYHLMERPDEHFFQAYIFPNTNEKFIEVKKNDVYWSLPRANLPFYQTLLSYSNGLASKTNYQKLSDFINVDAAADYITFHQFIGSFDWHDQQNTLLGAVPIKSAGPFEFVVWDVDFSLGNKGVLSMAYEFNKHGAVPENLFNAKEFKFLQGDKVACLCEDEGILSPKNLKEKYLYRAREVEVSLIAEAARWGNNDYSFGGDFPDHKAVANWDINTHWKAEFDRVYDDFLTNRTQAFIKKYIKLERYSTLNAVKAELVNNSLQLKHQNGSGKVVYMLNGEDPRSFGGALNTNALTYNGQPIKFGEPIELKARFYKNTSSGRKWSPMCPQKFYPKQNYQSLVMNELHIAPSKQMINEDTILSKHLEFIEIKNTSNEIIFLQDVVLEDGLSCQFKKSTQIAAHGYFVVAADSLSFINKYGFSPDAIYTGKLNNRGAAIRLIDPFGTLIDVVTYTSEMPWPNLEGLTDQSIALKNAHLNNNKGANWALQSVNFTPGKANQFCDDYFEIEATVNAVSCAGLADGFILPKINGDAPPYQFKWSTGSTAAQLKNLKAATYTLTVEDKNKCRLSQLFEVKEPSKLKVFITQNNVVTANVVGGVAPYKYQWDNGETMATLKSSVAKTYAITVLDKNRCTVTASINLLNEPTCLKPTNIKTTHLNTNSVTLTWGEKPGDSSYYIQYKKLSEGTPFMMVDNLNPIVLSNLEPCTTYKVKIMTLCVDSQNSDFSTSFYFKTLGCLPCPKVQNLVQLNSTLSSTSITWDAVPNTHYLLYYKTEEAQNWQTVETWINFAILFNLEACQTYQWKVAAKCEAENSSAHSNVLQFKTNACRLNHNVINENEDWIIYPNPVKNICQISFNHLIFNDEQVTIKLYDAAGQLQLSQRIDVGNRQSKIYFNVAALVPGIYYLNVFTDDRKLSKKIQIYD